MNVHLGAPSRSKNGNKFQFSLSFKVNDIKDLKLEKEVVDSAKLATAATPVFKNTFTDIEYTTSDVARALDGTATVSDGGKVTYSWSDGESVVGTEASYTPVISSAGETTYTVTATNTKDGVTATATQSVKITVTD